MTHILLQAFATLFLLGIIGFFTASWMDCRNCASYITIRNTVLYSCEASVVGGVLFAVIYIGSFVYNLIK